MPKTQMTLHQATKLADQIVAELQDGCEMIAIVGSIRRQRAIVGDVEILAVPRIRLDTAKPTSVLTERLDRLVRDNRLAKLKGKELQMQFQLVRAPDVHLDLFVASPRNWGVQMAIRTGPADFSHALVTRRCMKVYGTRMHGLLPDDLSIAEGWQVWRNRVVAQDKKKTVIEPGELIPMADEHAFLQLCCEQWIEPDQRDAFVEARR